MALPLTSLEASVIARDSHWLRTGGPDASGDPFDDWQAYLRQSDETPSSSNSTAAASGSTRSLPGSDDQPRPQKSSQRSTMSSKAKPFVPNSAAKALAERSGLMVMAPNRAVETSNLVQMAAQGLHGFQLSPALPYSESVQDDVFLPGVHNQFYDEELQDEVFSIPEKSAKGEIIQEAVYAQGQSRPMIAFMRGRRPAQDELGIASCPTSCQIRTPSRTPSPRSCYFVSTGGAQSKPVSALPSSRSLERQLVALHEFSKIMPVRHTFIHYQPGDHLVKSKSSPTLHQQLQQDQDERSPNTSTSADPTEMQLKHFMAECKPCAYFFHKEDGCRAGETCSFCHLCPPDELKKRKKQKAMVWKARARESKCEIPN